MSNEDDTSRTRTITPPPGEPAGTRAILLLRKPTRFYGVLGLGVPVLAAFGPHSPGRVMLLWAGGFAFWTWFEYAFHRWAQHNPRVRRRIRGWDDHARHHAHPEDVEDIIYTVRESIPVTGGVTLLALLVAPSWIPGLVAAAGFIAGYLVYEWVHAAAHSRTLRDLHPWLARLSALHARHHQAHPNGCYGFITSFWDRLLGTYYPP